MLPFKRIRGAKPYQQNASKSVREPPFFPCNLAPNVVMILLIYPCCDDIADISMFPIPKLDQHSLFPY